MKLATAVISLATALVAATTPGAIAQAQSVAARTASIVSAFNKEKHETKTRHGVRVEKYKKVQSVAVVKADPRGYSGTYEEAGLWFKLNISVDANGGVSGTGYEPVDFGGDVRRTFTLRDGKVDGALLTATKVYASGRTAPLEGAFIERTSFDSPSAQGAKSFGIGVLHAGEAGDGVNLDRLFLERQS